MRRFSLIFFLALLATSFAAASANARSDCAACYVAIRNTQCEDAALRTSVYVREGILYTSAWNSDRGAEDQIERGQVTVHFLSGVKASFRLRTRREGLVAGSLRLTSQGTSVVRFYLDLGWCEREVERKLVLRR